MVLGERDRTGDDARHHLPVDPVALTGLWTGWEGGVRRGGWLAAKGRVQRQFVSEGLLFAAVGEPVVDPDLGDQVGAQTGQLGGRHPPLETLGPTTWRWVSVIGSEVTQVLA